jgi:Restriction endonuclease
VPRRTNEFQQFVAYVYSSVAPTGATVTESAMLREGGTGTEREVDVLISHKVAGIDLQLAIECRDWTKDQDINWIDGLVGKYKRLTVNKVIAVSSTPFSPGARDKAAEERIELLTVQQAREVDWASRLATETVGIRTAQNSLMNVGTYDNNGDEITLTLTDHEGNITHKNKLSKAFFPECAAFYNQRLKPRVDTRIFTGLSEATAKWTDTRPRYCEVSVDNPGTIYIDESKSAIPIARIVFGIGVIIASSSNLPVTNKVLSDFMVSEFEAKRIGDHDYRVRFITAKEGGVIRFDLTLK